MHRSFFEKKNQATHIPAGSIPHQVFATSQKKI